MSNPIMPEQESLREQVYKALEFVQEKDLFVRKGTYIPRAEQVENVMHLIEQDREQAYKDGFNAANIGRMRKTEKLCNEARIEELESLPSNMFERAEHIVNRLTELQQQKEGK